MLRYFLPIGMGVPLIVAGVGHGWFGDTAARRLGWPAGSPFQRELGFWDLGAGIVAVTAAWASRPFVLAVVVLNAVFWPLAGIVHVRDMLAGNRASDNVATAAIDFLAPVTLVAIYLVSR